MQNKNKTQTIATVELSHIGFHSTGNELEASIQRIERLIFYSRSLFNVVGVYADAEHSTTTSEPQIIDDIENLCRLGSDLLTAATEEVSRLPHKLEGK